MDTILTLGSYVVAAGAVSILVWGLFRRFDAVSEEGLKQQIASWLSGRPGDPEHPADWARSLSELFDRLFGGALHSRRALLWSCLLSFASMLFLLVLFLILGLDSVQMVRGLDIAAEGTLQTVVGGAVFVAMMNFVPDYISLIQSRFIVRRIAAASATWARAGLVALDLALTFFTLFAFMFLFTFLGWALEGGVAHALSQYPLFVADFWWAIGPNSEHPVQLCFYSTFSTSVIIWLYGLGSFAMRNLADHNPEHRVFGRLIHADDPLRTLGAAASLIAFLSVLVLCFVVAPGEAWRV